MQSIQSSNDETYFESKKNHMLPFVACVVCCHVRDATFTFVDALINSNLSKIKNYKFRSSHWRLINNNFEFLNCSQHKINQQLLPKTWQAIDHIFTIDFAIEASSSNQFHQFIIWIESELIIQYQSDYRTIIPISYLVICDFRFLPPKKKSQLNIKF